MGHGLERSNIDTLLFCHLHHKLNARRRVEPKDEINDREQTKIDTADQPLWLGSI